MNAKRFLLLSALLLALLLSIGCAKPLPADKSNYVGQWQGLGVDMLILADGSFAYKRMKGGASTSINAPIKEFDGDDFLVGIGPITTRFDVTAPPHQVEGVWKMTVDGVELVRVGGPNTNESAPDENKKPNAI